MLEVNHIEVRYGDITVLYDVSCEVRGNEIVSIVGSNGAGKSTLLKTIAGLLHPSRGTIRFGEKDISQLSTAEIIRNGITYIPEERRIFGPLSVEENLRIGAYIIRNGDDIEKLLQKVYNLFPKLGERKKQKAGSLSGGEQQMLAIGRGLMSNPKILMLDEPSIGLMPKLVSEVMETIQTLKKEGHMVLLVEQKVQESLEIADRGYILQTGRIIAEGSGKELLDSDLVRKAYLGL